MKMRAGKGGEPLSPLRLIADAEELYELHHRTVYLYLLRLCGSPDLAEDLLQESFYRAIRGAAGYRGDASPATWICAIGRRLFLNHLARQKRESGRRSELDLELLSDPDKGPEGTIVQRQLIARALEGLTEEQRIALLLRDADGLSYQEIADVLGRSLPNTKLIIHRARVRFRDRYVKQGEA